MVGFVSVLLLATRLIAFPACSLRTDSSRLRSEGSAHVASQNADTFQLSSVSQEGRMKVSKRGKDLAVRLPVAIVRALELKAGDEIDVHIVGKRQLQVSRSNSMSGGSAPELGAEKTES